MAGLTLQNLVGKPRSLVDFVTITNAKKFPLMALFRKGPSVTNVHYEWDLDLYRDPADNAAIDGTDITSFNQSETAIVTVANRAQWFRDAQLVGTLAEADPTAGIKSHRAYAIKKAMEGLWIDLESALGSDNDVQVGGGAQPNKMRAVAPWIATSIATSGSGGTSGYTVPSTYLPTSDAVLTGDPSTALTPDALNTMLQAIWSKGGVADDDTYQLVSGATIKAIIAGFPFYASGTNAYGSIKTYTAELSGKTIWATADRFEGNFGKVEIIPDHFLCSPTMPGGSAALNLKRGLLLNPKHWELVWRWMPRVKPLPDLGGGERFMVDAYVGLRCYKPDGNGKIAGA